MFDIIYYFKEKKYLDKYANVSTLYFGKYTKQKRYKLVTWW